MVGQQLGQRIAEALPQISLHEGAAALTAQEQPFRFQALNGLSEKDGRHQIVSPARAPEAVFRLGAVSPRGSGIRAVAR